MTHMKQKNLKKTNTCALLTDMLTDKTFRASYAYLRSIRVKIIASNNITAFQLRAVNNIYIGFAEKE